jgi:hypothetical protein
LQYEILSDRHPGWTLAEVKQMPVYERRYWIDKKARET